MKVTGERIYAQLARLVLPPWVRAGGVDELAATYQIGLDEAVRRGRTAAGSYAAREFGSLLMAALRARIEGSPARSDVAPLLPTRDTRPLRVAWIVALMSHFVAFSVVIPVGEARVDALPERQVTVIRRLPPPPPPPPEKPVRRIIRRDVAPVPIPDPEPEKPELIIELDEILPDLVEEAPDFELWLPPPPPPPEPTVPSLVRVGVDVARPNLIEKVRPVYPAIARRARLECTVLLEARIDRDGRVADLRPVRSCGLGLEQAAMEAVGQWRYTPTRLGARPVEVMMTVSVRFELR